MLDTTIENADKEDPFLGLFITEADIESQQW